MQQCIAEAPKSKLSPHSEPAAPPRDPLQGRHGKRQKQENQRAPARGYPPAPFPDRDPAQASRRDTASTQARSRRIEIRTAATTGSASVVLGEIHRGVQIRHLIGIAIEQQRIPHVGAEKAAWKAPLTSLRPTWMGNLRIYVGVEPILFRSHRLPRRTRLLVYKADPHDRFDAFEAILQGTTSRSGAPF